MQGHQYSNSSSPIGRRKISSTNRNRAASTAQSDNVQAVANLKCSQVRVVHVCRLQHWHGHLDAHLWLPLRLRGLGVRLLCFRRDRIGTFLILLLPPPFPFFSCFYLSLSPSLSFSNNYCLGKLMCVPWVSSKE